MGKRLSTFAAALFAACLMLGIVTVQPATAAPAAPTILGPWGTVNTNSPALSWTRVDGAAKYELWIDDDATFASATKVTTVNSRWVPTTPLSNGQQYWEVRSIDAKGAPGEWAAGDFTIAQHSGPQLISPADNPTSDPSQALQQPDSPPVLTWQSVPGAIGYTVDVAPAGSGFGSDTQTFNTGNTSYVVPSQAPEGSYDWRVTAKFSSTVLSLPSDTWTYVIGPLHNVANAHASNGNPASNTDSDVIFSWEALAGAQYYNIWVSSDPNFNDTSATVVDPNTRVYGTSYSPPNNIDVGNYYWKVRGVNADGKYIDWSAVWCNGTDKGTSPTCTNEFTHSWTDKPTLLYPANGTATVSRDAFYFQWTPVPHATYYELDTGTDPNFSKQGVTYQTCTTAGTTYTPGYVYPSGDKCAPAPGVTTYWRVRAIDDPASINGIYSTSTSETQSFRYEACSDASSSSCAADMGTALEQTAPGDGRTVSVPTMTWTPAYSAVKYHVEVSDATAKVVAKTDTYSLSWTPSSPLGGTQPYSWTVQSVDASGKLSPKYANAPTFSVSGSTATGAEPLTPLTESDVAGTDRVASQSEDPNGRFPDLQWEPYAGAAYYKLCIGVASTLTCDLASTDMVLSTEWNYPAATSTGTHYLAPGSYDWWVTAYDSHDVPLASTPAGANGTFVIPPLATVTGTRVALDGESLRANHACWTLRSDTDPLCDNAPSTPVFAWDRVPGAGLYKIFVATDPNLQHLVYGSSINNVPSTSNTYWAPRLADTYRQLPDATAGTAYYWYVLPCRTDTSCNPNPISQSDITTNGFTKLSPQPTGLTQMVQGDSVTFSWDDYWHTNQATPWAEVKDAADVSYQEAQQYYIQISTSPSFPAGSGTWSATVDQTTFTPYASLLPDETGTSRLYWRVQAIDAYGNHLAWSAAQSFTKVSQSFGNLSTQPSGTTVPGTVTFAWDPVPFGVKYRISVYKNDDITQPLFSSVVTTQTAYSWNQPIPVSTQPYLWRVERQDASGNWAAVDPAKPRTDTGTFTVSGATPTQEYPSAAATLAGNDSYFTWSQVPGAASYKLEYGLATSTNVTSVTTPGLEYAPTGTISPGNYRWRVTALDNAGHPLSADAAWRALTIAGVPSASGSGGSKADTSGRPTITHISPARGSRLKVKKLKVKITFSEPVYGVSATSAKVTLKGKPIATKVSLSSDKRTLTLKTINRVKRKKTYKVSLTNSIKDVTGVALSPTSWKYRVK